MTALQLENISITYGKDTVVEDFSVEAGAEEFLVLLGPSGCGKSTLLRTIAGLIEPASGAVKFDGVDVTSQDPRERNIAFVFQSYALYPNLTVAQNIAFPLMIARFHWWDYLPVLSRFAYRRYIADAQIAAKVAEVAEMLSLGELLDQKPARLSGGQRQRVALARSLVRDPRMFLLDEPLSNLDAKLRTRLRVEIAALQRQLGRMFVYVTHDQVEAMTMATKIVVMRAGAVQQVGSPDEIYREPANTFVASFIGSPPMNIVAGELWTSWFPHATRDGAAEYGIRPEALRVDPAGVPGVVRLVEDLGSAHVYELELPGSTELVRLKSNTSLRVFVGETLTVTADASDVHAFDASGVALERLTAR